MRVLLKALILALGIVLTGSLVTSTPPAFGQETTTTSTASGETDTHTATSTTTRTESTDANGVTTVRQETETVIRDKQTGRVVRRIRRSRTIRRDRNGQLITRTYREEEAVNHADGTSTVHLIDEEFSPGRGAPPGLWVRDEATGQHAGPDGTGPRTGGRSERRYRNNGRRHVTKWRWDPQRGEFVVEEERDEPLSISRTAVFYLPEVAFAGGRLIGSVDPGQGDGPTSVVVRTREGREETVGIDPGGRFELPPSILVTGVLVLTFRTETGVTVGERTLRVEPAGAAGPAPRVPAGVWLIVGSNLFDAGSLLGPFVVLISGRDIRILPVLAASNREIRVRAARDVRPGTEVLLVDNGWNRLNVARPAGTGPAVPDPGDRDRGGEGG